MSQKEMSSQSAASMYAGADGFLNVAAVEKAMAMVSKKAEAEGLKPKAFFAISLKAKPGNYSAAKHKARDFKYLATRMVKVNARVRRPKETAARVIFIQYDGLKGELLQKQKSIVSAIGAHIKRLEKETVKVKDEKAKIRDAANAQYERAVEALYGVLEEAGVNVERDTVESTSMFGKTVLVKVGKDLVVSIGKSDVTKFNAAKRAARAAE